jgi:hypothetical protein
MSLVLVFEHHLKGINIMKTFRLLLFLVAAMTFIALPVPSLAQVSIGVGINVGNPPPPIPVYAQPVALEPNDIWTPGYWAWGPGGYFWVPGTWVEAPQYGYLWTPGYWGASAYGFSFNSGYWGTSVGFYGGVNYGAGYYGNGYVGGRWAGNVFRYNTFVTNVNSRITRNVYVDRTVFVNRSPIRIAYNGGRGGLTVRPSAGQLAILRGPHLGLTSVQREHILLAGQDRGLFASVNHGRPGELAVARPFSSSNRPVTVVHRAPAAVVRHALAPIVHRAAAPVVHRAAPAARHAGAPVVHRAAPVAQRVPATVAHHPDPAAAHAAPAPAHPDAGPGK